MIYRGVPLEDLPQAHYGTIYADPPWGFLTRSKGSVVAIPQRAPGQHYAPMSMKDLLALPVAQVAAPDCVLHMWLISSHVEIAIQLATSWGFKFKSLGTVWVKTQKHNPEVPKMSMGFWFRQEAEIALVFTRGSPKRLDAGVRQVILEPAREHSRKPDAGLDRVERLSAGPYLEMFSRSDRAGWDSWGDEAGKFQGHTRKTYPEVEALL
jgi:N6-adenosine-specific RNA methylase IME4